MSIKPKSSRRFIKRDGMLFWTARQKRTYEIDAILLVHIEHFAKSFENNVIGERKRVIETLLENC